MTKEKGKLPKIGDLISISGDCSKSFVPLWKSQEPNDTLCDFICPESIFTVIMVSYPYAKIVNHDNTGWAHIEDIIVISDP